MMVSPAPLRCMARWKAGDTRPSAGGRAYPRPGFYAVGGWGAKLVRGGMGRDPPVRHPFDLIASCPQPPSLLWPPRPPPQSFAVPLSLLLPPLWAGWSRPIPNPPTPWDLTLCFCPLTPSARALGPTMPSASHTPTPPF